MGAALKAVRFYSPGHALTRQTLEVAGDALGAYTAKYGPLALTVHPRGIVFDFHSQPYEDEVVLEFVRTLRSEMIRGARFLPGVTASELGSFVDVLRLPRQQFERAGGAGRLLRERGVLNVVIDDLAEEAREAAAAPSVQLLHEAMAASPERLAAYIEHASGGNPEAAVQLLREADRLLTVRPRDEREAGWRVLGAAVLAIRPPLQQDVGRRILSSPVEPWAASIASQWSATLAADVLPPGAAAQQTAMEWLQSLGQRVPAAPIPPPGDVNPADLDEARNEFTRLGPADLRGHAVGRLLGILPSLDAIRFEECLAVLEQEAVAAAEAEEFATVIQLIGGLTTLARRFTDPRQEMARAAVHRMVSIELRDVLIRTAAAQYPDDHPYYQALRNSPDEVMLFFIKLAGAEERPRVREQMIRLLSSLTQGRLELIHAAMVQPEWRTRVAALDVLAQLRSVESLQMLADALRQPDPQVRAAGAQRLGSTGMPEAVGPLVRVLQDDPLHESVEVKLEVVRALGELGTEGARAALEWVLAAEDPHHRREMDELKQEAARALQAWRERRR